MGTIAGFKRDRARERAKTNCKGFPSHYSGLNKSNNDNSNDKSHWEKEIESNERLSDFFQLAAGFELNE